MTLVILLVVLFYISICLAMFLLQEKLVFPRHIAVYERLNRVFTQEGFEKYELEVAQGITLKGILSRGAKKNAPLIFVFSGNGHDVIGFVRFLRSIYSDSYQIVGLNYRGYGLPSYRSDGAPSQKALLQDALVSYDKIVEDLKPSAVYLLGYSLGSSVGAYVLRERDAKGLVAVAPFDSVCDLAQGKHFYLPVKLMLKHPFLTRDFVTGNAKPISIIAGKKDAVVPLKNLLRLKEVVESLRYDVIVEEAGHVDLLDHPDFPNHLRAALEGLEERILPDNVVQLKPLQAVKN